MYTKIGAAAFSIVFVIVIFLQYEISNTVTCYVVGSKNITSHEYVLQKYNMGWLARALGLTYSDENDATSFSNLLSQTAESDLILQPTFSAETNKATNAKPPPSTGSTRVLARHIVNKGEICLQIGDDGTKLTAIMQPAGCWGTGCYNVSKRKLSLVPVESDVNGEKALRISSSFVLIPNQNRKVCARDCRGVKPAKTDVVIDKLTPYTIYIGAELVGKFSPTEKNKQCFQTTKGGRIKHFMTDAPRINPNY